MLQIINFCTPLLKNEFNVPECYSQATYNRIKTMSWGARDFKNLSHKGLLFRVSGHHHKGYVLITYDYTDTYQVYLISTTFKIVKQFEQVYCDMLQDLIDENIERIPEYIH